MLLTDEEFPSTTNQQSLSQTFLQKNKQIRKKYSPFMKSQVWNSKGELETRNQTKETKIVEISLNLDKDNEPIYIGKWVLQDE